MGKVSVSQVDLLIKVGTGRGGGGGHRLLKELGELRWLYFTAGGCTWPKPPYNDCKDILSKVIINKLYHVYYCQGKQFSLSFVKISWCLGILWFQCIMSPIAGIRLYIHFLLVITYNFKILSYLYPICIFCLPVSFSRTTNYPKL